MFGSDSKRMSFSAGGFYYRPLSIAFGDRSIRQVSRCRACEDPAVIMKYLTRDWDVRGLGFAAHTPPSTLPGVRQERRAMTSVFVSHSSRDRADAVQVRRILKDVGCQVWLDATDMRAAEDLEGQLAKAITDADVFCLLLSPTPVASTWVDKEIELAKREREQRGLRLLPIILRPCDLPPAIVDSGLRAFQMYDGVESDYIRLQLVRAVTDGAAVGEVEIDEALRRHLADVARQKEAERVLPALAKGLDRIRKLPIRSVEVGLDQRIFTQPAYFDDPFVLEVRLRLDPLFNRPMSFFFAPFQEGSTWPDEFNFLPRSIHDFRDDQPRIDGRFRWSGYEATLSQIIDDSDLRDAGTAFTLTLDGSEHSPRSSGGSSFHASMPGLRTRLEVPSLEKLVADGCTFAVITHHWRTRTAKPVEPDQTDVGVRVVARFRDADHFSCTLFRSDHDAREPYPGRSQRACAPTSRKTSPIRTNGPI
jgi:hypothetical protein